MWIIKNLYNGLGTSLVSIAFQIFERVLIIICQDLLPPVVANGTPSQWQHYS